MSAGMTRTVSAHHDRLVQAVSGLVGRELTAADVKAAYAAAHPSPVGDVQWVIASDHCSNQTNKGACACAMTEWSVFERLGRNRYRVLAQPNAPTAGPSQLTPPHEGVAGNRPPQSPPAPPSVPEKLVADPTRRVEVTLVSPADRDGSLGRAKLILEVAVVAVTLLGAISALVWRPR